MDHHSGSETRGETTRRGRSSWLALAGWIVLTAMAAAAGAIASSDASVFYGALTKPSWAPPSWLFGPVWSALYLMMAIAAWLVWRTQPTAPADRAWRRRALALFVAQLVLNALWTWLFFAWRQGAASFAEIGLLWIALAVTIWHFGKVRALAAYLLVPYLAWVSFAMALTWAIWQRNPGQL